VKVRVLIYSLIASCLAAAEEPRARQTPMVTVPYDDYQRLIDQSRKKEPAYISLTDTSYVATMENDSLRVEATYTIEASGELPGRCLLLAGKGIVIEKSSSSGAQLQTKGNQLYAHVKKQGIEQVGLVFRIPKTKNLGGGEFNWKPGQTLRCELTLNEFPSDAAARVEGGVAIGGNSWLLPPGQEVSILLSKSAPSTQEAIELPAVVKDFACDTRVVRDGTFYSNARWTVAHDTPVRWVVNLSGDNRIVAARINGKPFQPQLDSGGNISIPVEEVREKPTSIDIEFTGEVPAFQPIRGEVTLKLPSTPTLVERTRWRIRLPEGLTAVAVQGDLEPQPPEESTIVLTKELTRGQTPTADIYYDKPETQSK